MLQGFWHFAEFYERVGLHEMASDERFASHELLAINAGVVTTVLRGAISKRPLNTGKSICRGSRVSGRP